MKILFEFSRGGLPENYEYYSLIRKEILDHEHTLTNDLLGETNNSGKPLPEGIYQRVSKAISEADCIIIEGSIVSLSLGYVLTEALNLGKPVLFVVKSNQLKTQNRFAWSISSKLLTNKSYMELNQLKDILRDFFENNEFVKTRFNLVLPNQMNSYITVKSKEGKISKTEYILNLIEKDIKG
ncbi:MAG: hypothetical protein M3P33_01155 [bacterium]|nr:hypothetical protein [bacterium]